MQQRTIIQLTLLSVLILISAACAKVPYQYTPVIDNPSSLKLKAEEAQIERGEPYSVIDFIGCYQPFALLSKLILWNWKIENHDLSPETEQALVKYLADNHLADVKVRLNQYSPGDEFSRLYNNTEVGFGWRYTLGLISVLSYTILPGRIFGGDSYNPYTNSISLYSDHPAVALHEGGHSKYFTPLEYKGTSAFFYMLPLVSLYFEAEATGDAIGYTKAVCSTEMEEKAYKVLYPAYGTYVGGEFANMLSYWTTVNGLVGLAAVIPGHIAGRIKAANVEDSCAKPPEPQNTELLSAGNTPGGENEVNTQDEGKNEPSPE